MKFYKAYLSNYFRIQKYLLQLMRFNLYFSFARCNRKMYDGCKRGYQPRQKLFFCFHNFVLRPDNGCAGSLGKLFEILALKLLMRYQSKQARRLQRGKTKTTSFDYESLTRAFAIKNRVQKRRERHNV